MRGSVASRGLFTGADAGVEAYRSCCSLRPLTG